MTNTNPLKKILSRLKSRRSKQIIASCFAFFFIFALSLYWQYAQTHLTTENSYVNADAVHMASQISGSVSNLYVENYQIVRKGDPLFDIDPTPFKVLVEEANANIAQNQAKLKNSQANLARIQKLVDQEFLPPEEKDNAITALDVAIAELKLSEATLAKAELDLSYTKICAPNNGIIQNLQLRPGAVIPAKIPLFVLIGTEKYWVDANFKETQLTHLKKGQRATVQVDMYPHHTFEGIVENISGSSGTAFSLLPAQNATGNWVKVTQRIPVRIRIKTLNPNYPLRVGSTATVTVNTSNNTP